MTYTKILVIILLIIVILVTIIIIILLMYKVPGIFMNLGNNCDTWLDHDIGQSFLTNEELKDITDKLNVIPKRNMGSVMSVIGTAAYLDFGPEYSNKAAVSNTILLDNFGELYDKLLIHLEQRLPNVDTDIPVKCQYGSDHGISMPGFHIFSGKSLLGKGWAIALFHVDMQELNVPWPAGYEFDMGRTYSFTIPISVTLDSGLYIFNSRGDDISKILPLSISLKNVKRQKVYYKNGHCYLHDGKLLHLISPFKGKQSDGSYSSRITMQGHALYCITTQSYWLYW